MTTLSDFAWDERTFDRYAKFESPGDWVAGEVLWFDPHEGDSDFDDQPCGFLDLKTFDGQIVRVCLDNQQKVDKVRNAHPHPGSFIAMKYEGEVDGKNGKKYKRYKVCRGRPKGESS